MFKNIENKWLNVFNIELQTAYNKAPNFAISHDINHINRVLSNAKKICLNLDKFDFEIVIASVFFHDLGRHYPEGKEIHGPLSAAYARPILEKIKFPKDKIQSVLDCISNHDEFFSRDNRPTIEAKILYDADKMDSFGSVGIARFLVFRSIKGESLGDVTNYALDNLPKRWDGLELEETKKIAIDDYNYIISYFEKLKGDLI